MYGRALTKTYQVCGNNRVQRSRVEHHPSRHGVHKHLVELDVRELLCNAQDNLVPQNHSVALRVALGHIGKVLPGPALRSLESKTRKALDAMARENGDFGGSLPGPAAVRAASLAGVLALAVLADDDPVQVAGAAVAQRRLGATEDLCRSDVGVLLEGLADGQAESP